MKMLFPDSKMKLDENELQRGVERIEAERKAYAEHRLALANAEPAFQRGYNAALMEVQKLTKLRRFEEADLTAHSGSRPAFNMKLLGMEIGLMLLCDAEGKVLE